MIELLVAVGIFAFVVAMGSGVFAVVLRVQRNAEQHQNVADNARATLEIMARAIRVSAITTGDNAYCTKPGGIENGDLSCLIIGHPTESSITYALNGTKIQRNGEDITSSQVLITRLTFKTSGVGIDGVQNRVTIVLEAQGTSTRPGEIVRLNLQTTITMRPLDT